MSNLGVEEEKGDEKVKINPYNVNNKLICEEDIYRILKKTGIEYDIRGLDIYQLAFIHKSYCKKKDNEEQNIEIAERPEDALELMDESNERLEYFAEFARKTNKRNNNCA